MGFSLNKQSNRTDYNLREYMCDTEADIPNVPTDGEPGSTLFIIETSAVYMLTTEHEWKEI